MEIGEEIEGYILPDSIYNLQEIRMGRRFTTLEGDGEIGRRLKAIEHSNPLLSRDHSPGREGAGTVDTVLTPEVTGKGEKRGDVIKVLRKHYFIHL